MRIAASVGFETDDNYLKFLRQYGVHDLIFGAKGGEWATTRFPPEKAVESGNHWKTEELVKLKNRFEKFGFRFACIENPVPFWCWDKIQMGKPGRDVQIENLAMTIRAMGEAGIPIMGYCWIVNPHGATRGSFRTTFNEVVRGDAIAEGFDLDMAKDLPLYRDRVYSEEEMWDYYEYFVKAIAPVLEESGVKMGLHPDDPPVKSLGGMPRLFGSPEGFRKGVDIANSPNIGLNMCLGNWAAMGTDILAAVDEFGSRGLIYYAHAQGVTGTVPKFIENFIDEADCDFFSVMRAIDEVAQDAFILPGHFPHTAGETSKRHQAHAFSIGYLAALNKVAGMMD